jgi:hypothetical protein
VNGKSIAQRAGGIFPLQSRPHSLQFPHPVWTYTDALLRTILSTNSDKYPHKYPYQQHYTSEFCNGDAAISVLQELDPDVQFDTLPASEI